MAGSPTSFYWHDYETWGRDPVHDRPAQFAAQRTNADLIPEGDPDVWFMKPPTDRLPDPEACAITGILPDQAEREGIDEPAFAANILKQMSKPGTCVVGWNSFRFDDEVTRCLLYRDLRPPYDREWRNGNTRWDLIEVARMFRALRPEGIVWPDPVEGRFSFRLQDLMAANHLQVRRAHEAMSDVESLIAFSNLARTAQPALWAWCLEQREKATAVQRIDAARLKGIPMLHVGTRHPADSGGCGFVWPIAIHPTQSNKVLCIDLREDPASWMKQDPAHWAESWLVWDDEEGAAPRDRRPPGPIFAVAVNRMPTLAPAAVIKDAPAWPGLDVAKARQHWEVLKADANLAVNVRTAFTLAERARKPAADADAALYEAFIPSPDAAACARAHLSGKIEDWRAIETSATDPRIHTLAWRRRMRCYPESASAAESQAWREECAARLRAPSGRMGVTPDAYRAATRAAPDDAPLVTERKARLRAWGDACMTQWPATPLAPAP